MLPIQHITKIYKVKFPAAVSLCASCRHSGGEKYYSLQYHSSVQLNILYRIKAWSKESEGS